MEYTLSTSFLMVFLTFLHSVTGHGRLWTPLGRSTMWRDDLYNTPPNYNDNELNCGGFNNQWNAQNNGKCGLCGDPYQGPRLNEAGGTYATGIIVKKYPAGTTIDVSVDITANHKGWNEFRICKNDNFKKPINQTCLDKYLLAEIGTGLTRIYFNSDEKKIFTWTLQLPAHLTCTQCVLQWKWNCGNSWGKDPITGEECVGCGPQEQFYGCADIEIYSNGNQDSSTTTTTPASTAKTTTSPPTTKTTTSPPTTKTTVAHPTTTMDTTTQADTTTKADTTTQVDTTTQAATTTATTTQSPTDNGSKCRAVPPYDRNPDNDDWCVDNCAAGFCPSSHCQCGNGKKKKVPTATLR